jgi:hypothetical protein
MPHTAVTARSYRYRLEKVEEWLEERSDIIEENANFDYKRLDSALFNFFSALLDGADPETWDLVEIRRRQGMPIQKMPEKHRLAFEEVMIDRAVKADVNEQQARSAIAMGQRIIADHEREHFAEAVREYEDEKYGAR